MVNICNILQNQLGSILNDTICVSIDAMFEWNEDFFFFDWDAHQLTDAILWSLRNRQCHFAYLIWTVNDK